jgi:hypothetical protein
MLKEAKSSLSRGQSGELDRRDPNGLIAPRSALGRASTAYGPLYGFAPLAMIRPFVPARAKLSAAKVRGARAPSCNSGMSYNHGPRSPPNTARCIVTPAPSSSNGRSYGYLRDAA